MKLTCTQMDVLISFYIENELSLSLKSKVEEHLKECANCRAKYDIIKTMFTDLKDCLSENSISIKDTPAYHTNSATSQQYRVFKNNLSAYLDNELSEEESIKIKKFTINNQKARQDLENSYKIRHLMGNSFQKAKKDVKHDFSKRIMHKLDYQKELDYGIHPFVKIIIAFVTTVLILSTIVLFSLNTL